MNSKCDIQNMTGHMQPKTIIQTGFEIFLGLFNSSLDKHVPLKKFPRTKKGCNKNLELKIESERK